MEELIELLGKPDMRNGDHLMWDNKSKEELDKAHAICKRLKLLFYGHRLDIFLYDRYDIGYDSINSLKRTLEGR